MTMLRKIGRLFVIKTRFEAWVVTYAIAVGAVERGRHYLEIHPGWLGWTFALLCTGVVFLAGGKLLDSVREPAPAIALGPHRARTQRHGPLTRRSRPRVQSSRRASASRTLRHTD
jgi:hypothetical protein